MILKLNLRSTLEQVKNLKSGIDKVQDGLQLITILKGLIIKQHRYDFRKTEYFEPFRLNKNICHLIQTFGVHRVVHAKF